ncbi:MAG TPA: hypothetical protein VGN18_04000 [Jatrophihabitans sp.]|uniref:COG1470 family protein n=1 Tax=Jatrophihabitans sp. TaxID=1932789 RepID=UPI002E064828|nr:hypothetical protein [Jatrophihabitans sp.]
MRVEPGATTTTTMLVRNTGQVVDQFTIDIVGDCAPWTEVTPAIVNLMPGSDVEVTVTFAPARDPHIPAGVVPFGLRVASREDPQGSSVTEGTVDVGAFDDVQVELVPRQSRGRRRARHQVAIDNLGNQPTTVEVTAHDEEEALDFAFDHRVATLEPGSAAFIRLIARPEKRFLKGADRQHPFIVTVAPSTSNPVATRGTMTQRQLLPAWLLPAIAILAAAALALFILYETLLKPAIKSTADDAAKQAVKSAASSQAAAVSSAQKQAAAANAAAQKAQAAASSAAKNGGGAGGKQASVPPSGSTLSNGAPVATGSPTAFSVQTDVAPSTGNFTKFTVTPGPTIPANKTLVITAVVLQNPNGNEGTLQIQRGNSSFLLQEGLANFRDLDYHFDDEPLIFTSSAPLQVAVNCQKAGGGGAAHCNPSILFTGRYITTPKKTP